MTSGPAVFLLTGIMAAGKSTVAERLARRFPRAAHVGGDSFFRMVVSGRADMTPNPSDEALRQLRLRYRQAAAAADAFFEAGFAVVIDDVILGPELSHFRDLVRSRPLFVVVLCPRLEVVAAREAHRSKTGYVTWTVAQLDAALRNETPRLGLWIDSSDQTVDETVDEILARASTEAAVSS